MAEQVESFPGPIHHYFVPAVVATLAIPLWHLGGAKAGAAALLTAFLSFLSTRHLMRCIRMANEQKNHLDQQLLQSQKLASIGELSSGIAHEINNPLAIIGQEIEWVNHLMNGQGPAGGKNLDDLRDSLREIAHQVDRCREITHKLLDFARKKEPLIQGVDMNKLIEDMAKLVEREAVLKDIQIVRDFQKDLPLVHTDAPLIRQVVLNLLNNATQAIGREGQVTITTRLSSNHSVDFTVSDSGCGIPRENLGKIFDPFFTTKPPGEGTGLGLSICHGIVQRLGGRISVESEVGKGTTFIVDLPEQQREGEA